MTDAYVLAANLRAIGGVVRAADATVAAPNQVTRMMNMRLISSWMVNRMLVDRFDLSTLPD